LADAERESEILREANLALESPSNALNVMLGSAWRDVMIRERSDRVPSVIEGALDRVPLESLDPVDRPYTNLANLYALIGDTEHSRAVLREYVATVDVRIRKSDEEDYHLSLGMIALSEGRPREAIDEFKVAVRKGNWPFNPFLGRAYDAAGEPDSALAAYEQYINTPIFFRMFIDPTNLASSYYRAAELHEEKGDFDRAVDYYSRFTELWKDADPELQPRVQAAQARINALMAERPKS